MKTVCKKCKGENVEYKIWYSPNTDTKSIPMYIEDIEDCDTWCNDCEERHGIEFK